MKVSFIVPVYNVGQYLPQCVDSILCQTYGDFEVILVDDGSTDRSGGICDQYAADDARVRVIHKSNGGLSDARNAGLNDAAGDYVVFMDSDDFWRGDSCLEQLVEILRQEPSLDFVGFNCSYYYHFKKKYIQWKAFSDEIIRSRERDVIVQSLVRSGTFPMSACLKIIKRQCLIDNQLYFKKGLLSEDIPWFLDLLDKAASYRFVNLYIYAYRQGRNDSITRSFSIKSFDDLSGIIAGELGLLPQRNFLKETKQALLSFMAYEFCILLARIVVLPENVREAKRRELMEYRWLLQYVENPKVRLVSRINRVFGIRITEKILNLFMMTK